MRAKLTITSFIYLTILIALSFTWNYLYSFLYDTSREMKGDDIFFCIALIAILTYLYIFFVRTTVKKQFPFLLVFVTPFISCLMTIMLILLLASPFNFDTDYKSLQAYFYLHGVVTIVLIYFVIEIRKMRNRKLS